MNFREMIFVWTIVYMTFAVSVAQKLVFRSNRLQEADRETQSNNEVAVHVGSVICQDGAHECPDFQTCCAFASGEWGCCPLPRAVCCTDGDHCCPHDTTCDVSAGKCVKGDTVMDWYGKVSAVHVGSVICPDGAHECPDFQTCCMLSSGEWGCCPLPNAVCCSDGDHCCPRNTICDVSAGTCRRGNTVMDWYEKVTAVHVGSVICPDGAHECPDFQTCCKLVSGEWGCCPLPSAICCSDGNHCCPHDTTCDVSAGKCLKGDTVMDWYGKVSAVHVGSVICPDGAHECPDFQTCCMLSSGEWGCCPLPNAVCCSDGNHCCPRNTICDVSAGKCLSGNTVMDWYEKVAAVHVGSVICPDGAHECPDYQTCCMLSSGEWGCCPLPNAVCCSDGDHCCPHDTTCDVSVGKCLKGDTVMDWYGKISAVHVGSVICPDRAHECPDFQTCCMLSSGEWGCCPLPNAVCCSDGDHCCPRNTICDVSAGTCRRGNTTMDWYEKVAAVHVGSVICPDGAHECPDFQTCCKLASGEWGCCPLPSAVCCNDGNHCCPHETTCDVSAGKCLKGDTVMDWYGKVSAVHVGSVICPDGAHECPDFQTCCMLSSGEWGCCPLPNAVCCSDGNHCCPRNTICDVSAGKCLSGNTVMDWYEKVAAVHVGSVICPDGAHECPDFQTCCMLSSGEWGCCPLPNAVCCSDGDHCCPRNTICNVSAGTCRRGNTVMDWYEKVAAVHVGSVICPDGAHECPDFQTCCKLVSGQWGCCPLPSAVCCSDGDHCCPHDTTCDVSVGKCLKGDTVMDWYEKVSAVHVGSVICPDRAHECPDNQTCCMLSSGEWGCCPLPNAVCCSDGDHCCPRNTICDVSAGTCRRGNTVMDWYEKVAAVHVGSIICPDGAHECPDFQTCCKLASGEWGCCPLPSAVCCSDGNHCCPRNTICDVSAGKCLSGNTVMDWYEKVAAVHVGSVICPDGAHECPDFQTCCMLSSGEWGCCPLPNAVCCSDGDHCCPRNTICNVSAGTCRRGNTVMDWYEKVAAVHVGSVICPDGAHECPDFQTCCKLVSGQWGCCPLPSAVCCSDGDHCCPHDTTCDVSVGKCLKGDTVMDWYEKVSAVHVGSVICPDRAHECPDNQTCCMLSSGEWGCCPLPNAVCCSDGDHCCPRNTICDVSAGTCRRGNTVMDWYEKVAAVHVGSIICPDGAHECPDFQTCCKLASGEWGCCPLPSAVCCSDGNHCCPRNTICDVSAGKCLSGNTAIDWYEKVAAVQLGSVICPDGAHECPDNQTCCMLLSGEWGCCPLPNAVCCSDGDHCCPRDTTCDVSAGKCLKGDTVIDLYEKNEATIRIHDMAVCCSDGHHCCPQGYRCNQQIGMCVRGFMRRPWFQNKRKTFGCEISKIHKAKTNIKTNLNGKDESKVNVVVCPDQKVTCPDQYTCCSNRKGSFSCCPMLQGVCCADHIFCCPHGYVCDEEPGICRIPEAPKPLSSLLKMISTKKKTPLL